ncbi:MAG TPA: carbohydrate ABC transporter permease [Bacilli bacterium]|nr:carbohydrate ABC transporter permease [Bacilli bacterium]
MGLKASQKRRKIIAFWLLLILAVIWLLPLFWALGTSFKSVDEITNNVLALIPRRPTLDNYIKLFNDYEVYPIFAWLRNSFLVATIHTLLYLILISFAGYAFGVAKWRGRDFIFSMLLATMMIPNVVNLIPLFTIVVDFGWLDDNILSFLALIMPGLGGVFGLFIVRQFFMGIPEELIENAKVEGLGHFRIYWYIIVPLGKSALLVAGLFAFMGSWNDYLWPSIIASVVQDANFYTLQTGLATMQSNTGYEYGQTMAAAIISIIPVLIVYMFVQDKIIEGVSRTGIK